MRASIARATLMLLLLTTPHLADAQTLTGDTTEAIRQHPLERAQANQHANVQKLKAAWVLQLGTLRAQESTPPGRRRHPLT